MFGGLWKGDTSMQTGRYASSCIVVRGRICMHEKTVLHEVRQRAGAAVPHELATDDHEARPEREEIMR